jgi:O-antigen ligase
MGPGHAILRWTGPGGLYVDRYSHNEYLQVLTDLGIIGAALAALFAVTVGRLLWRGRADLPERAPVGRRRGCGHRLCSA